MRNPKSLKKRKPQPPADERNKPRQNWTDMRWLAMCLAFCSINAFNGQMPDETITQVGSNKMALTSYGMFSKNC
jgi:hypothetical protein